MLIVDHPYHTDGISVVGIGDLDAGPLVGGVNDLSVADVDRHMADAAAAAVEEKVTGLRIGG